MDEYAQASAQVQLAMMVKAFLDGPIGQYVARRAEDERQAALEELATVHPGHADKIAALQTKVRVRDDVMRWLADALTAGQVAHARLAELESDD